jgi:hypothetical protein
MYLNNKQLKAIVSTRPPDPNFRWKLKENEWGVFIMVSKKELGKYSYPKQLEISEYLANMCNSIRQQQIPCYIAEWKEDE